MSRGYDLSLWNRWDPLHSPTFMYGNTSRSGMIAPYG